MACDRSCAVASNEIATMKHMVIGLCRTKILRSIAQNKLKASPAQSSETAGMTLRRRYGVEGNQMRRMSCGGGEGSASQETARIGRALSTISGTRSVMVMFGSVPVGAILTCAGACGVA